ncbi:MAG: peptide-methionine (R)-S-oxide reductase MsrB [Gammaproteobacteria bacterium]
MNRRNFLRALAGVGATFGLGVASAQTAAAESKSKVSKLMKSKAEWKKLLSREQYQVLFEEDTERPGTSPLNGEKRPGLFLCAACYLPLFDARHKFESGTGWPSFFDRLPGRIATRTDFKLIWPRTEYHCARCEGHQGHVFDDGPAPTGLRYCNNGVALRFVAAGEPLPELRT